MAEAKPDTAFILCTWALTCLVLSFVNAAQVSLLFGSSLAGLPEELLEVVVGYVMQKQHYNLRLTCKALCEIASRYVKVLRFQHYSPKHQHLQALLAKCKNVDTLFFNDSSFDWSFHLPPHVSKLCLHGSVSTTCPRPQHPGVKELEVCIGSGPPCANEYFNSFIRSFPNMESLAITQSDAMSYTPHPAAIASLKKLKRVKLKVLNALQVLCAAAPCLESAEVRVGLNTHLCRSCIIVLAWP